MKDFYGNTIESRHGTDIVVGGSGDYKNDTVEAAITRLDNIIDMRSGNANGMWIAEKYWTSWGYVFKFLCTAGQCLVIANNELFVVWPSGAAGTDLSVRRVADNKVQIGNSVTFNLDNNYTFRRGDKPGERYIYLSSNNKAGFTVFS